MELRCSMGSLPPGGMSQGRTPADGPPKACVPRGTPHAQKPLSPSVLRATMMFNPNPASVNYVPSWQQVLRAVQQCYMPVSKGVRGVGKQSPAPSPAKIGQHTARPSLLEYYQDFLASDDEGGWERVLQQASVQPQTMSTSSLATFNTYSGSYTSLDEPHGDPQDDELFCMRADMAPTAARLKAAGLRPPQQARSSPRQASRSASPPLPDLSGLSELEQQRVRLQHAVQLIRDPDMWQDARPPSPPRTPSPTIHRRSWSPAAGSMSLSSFDDVPSSSWQAIRPAWQADAPSLSSHLDDEQHPGSAAQGLQDGTVAHTSVGINSSQTSEAVSTTAPGHASRSASPQPHPQTVSTEPRGPQSPGGALQSAHTWSPEDASWVASQQSMDDGCVLLSPHLGVVERQDDFVDHVELEEVMHQLRTSEAGAPANNVMPAEKTEDNMPDPDGEGPPASAADIITGGQA